MSPGDICYRGTNYLTEKYVGPTVSLKIVAGEGIPVEHSPAKIPQRQVAGKTFPQRQVVGESPEISLGNVVSVVVLSLFPAKSYNKKYGWKKVLKAESQRSPSAKKYLGRTVVLNEAGWLRSSVAREDFHDDRYDCLFSISEVSRLKETVSVTNASANEEISVG
nr:hypothetical protein [Tanacetum cinerariifolium]